MLIKIKNIFRLLPWLKKYRFYSLIPERQVCIQNSTFFMLNLVRKILPPPPGTQGGGKRAYYPSPFLRLWPMERRGGGL